MESRLGHDFRQLRIHSDTSAAKTADSVNAIAYTVGRDVVFSSGQYAPHTRQGLQLLAHELAHVVQQEDGALPGSEELQISEPGDLFEREADNVANEVMKTGPDRPLQTRNTPGSVRLTRSSPGLQRSAKFTDGKPDPVLNLAERVVAQEFAGNTDFVLNGTPLVRGIAFDAAVKALSKPSIPSVAVAGGKECSVDSEPNNEISYDMKVLKSGDWSQVTTKGKIGELYAGSDAPGLDKCSGADRATLVVEPNEEVRKGTLTHEGQHAKDYKSIFQDEIVPWDTNVTAAYKQKLKMHGKDDDTCARLLYRVQVKKPTPEDLMRRIIDQINEKSKAFHDKPEGQNVIVSIKQVGKDCDNVTLTAK